MAVTKIVFEDRNWIVSNTPDYVTGRHAWYVEGKDAGVFGHTFERLSTRQEAMAFIATKLTEYAEYLNRILVDVERERDEQRAERYILQRQIEGERREAARVDAQFPAN